MTFFNNLLELEDGRPYPPAGEIKLVEYGANQ
jgi:hypothetical protein